MKMGLLIAPALIALGGCVTPAEVADHRTITLQDAVFDVARSLHAVRDEYAGRRKIGLGVSKATVVFNISASSTEQNQLKIEAAAGESVGFPLSGMYQRTLTNVGQRGNTITIEFAPAPKPQFFRVTAKPPGSAGAAAALDAPAKQGSPPATGGGSANPPKVTDELFQNRPKHQ
jgi:hypothetical protein